MELGIVGHQGQDIPKGEILETEIPTGRE